MLTPINAMITLINAIFTLFQDFADAVEQMRIQGRYNELLFMVDTCQAATLGNHFYSKDVITIGSSLKDQNSYSHSVDAGIGVSIMDRFSYMMGAWIKQKGKDSNAALGELFQFFKQHPHELGSNVGIRTDLFQNRPFEDVKVSDFFGSVKRTHVLNGAVRTIEPSRANTHGYPAHWGEPPERQTRDLRELPGGYGQGSGTLAHWIQNKLDTDAQSGGDGGGDGGAGGSRGALPHPSQQARLGARGISLGREFVAGLCGFGVLAAYVSLVG